MSYLKTTFNIRYLPALSVLAVIVAAAVLAFHVGPPAETAGGPQQGAPQRLVAILQYLGHDYPAAVASNDSGELAEQRSLTSDATAIAERIPNASALAARVASIDSRVRQGTDPSGVSADCASVVDDLVAATGISRMPAAPPDLEEGARLFRESCAACHGSTGQGDGPAAAALNPKPASFHSAEVMAGFTPFRALNVIRFGVKGTAMVPFETLDDKQRWALAFYVFSLREPACDHTPPRVSLDLLANRSDEELAKSVGAGEVACLRRTIRELDAPALLTTAKDRIREASQLFGHGDHAAAERVALDAYLSDVEPVEPWLRARAPEALTQLEASFTTTRTAFHDRDPRAREDAALLMALLERAAGAGAHATTTRASAFWFALLVIVREGFEAAVIVAALLAVVKKRKQGSRARFVHAGWTSAIAVGAVAFALGRKALAGAMDEKLEGCLAFVAVAMLLNAALWLNARATTRKTMGDLRERTRGALDSGAFALFAISFLAVFRESFETAVFLEALSIDAPSAVVWGAFCGTALLLTLVVAVSRLGLRLPMQTLFKASTVVLFATAVVLLGQGIHAFEVVGLLPSHAMPFLHIEFLGIYPDRLSVLAQIALCAAPILWKTFCRSPSPVAPGLHPAE
jgi:high-affinity iron transporter